ncbi:amino acid adenylation domain-containing protein [Actinophytocola sp.]|uniref:amino acid adenylation domain-containing protein n=1 Tax=Actinophytocola sp. TaxID=1872138 RepID=UPI002D6C140D|nr:amino acid adenylation domain-containing protein [Actinophytocola sp.]HYQ65261.1 amino acid adenylation domain-containing protein [Actinophytocola sp.]
MSTDRADALRRRLARQRGLSVVDGTLVGVTSLDEGFRRTVARHPDRPAVRHDGTTVSYRELDRRVTELAGALDVDPTAPVGILLDRSVDMVAAALAVVRAGASYVPIDPATPPARVAAILTDAAPSAVITSSALADLVDAPVVLADRALPTGGGARPSTWDTRAYVIFTSGTTGRPKGVQVTHGNLLRLFTTTEAQYGFGTSDVWTLFHSFAFDFSVWEMWGPLLYGGCLVIVPREVAKDPVAFRELLRTERVTMLSQTPTAFNQLIAEDARHADRLPVRWVVFGGEALHFGDLRPWVAKYGDTAPALANMYGITETTVHASFRRVRHADLSLTGSHIGTPLSDLDFTLLDVSPDGAGEIVVTGPGVATGYLNRPELTAERFVSVEGTRGYRSGDLAARLPNGEYVYHGRKDDQVKIRGFRIELGEVEGAVRAVPGVARAVVVAQDLPGQGATLIAYVVSSLPAADLRQALAKSLPEYMIPARFEFLDTLPMNGNGKLDRAALPTPGQAPRRAATDLMDPVTARVHAMVAGLLDAPAVTPAANFFELGGHSLLATRLLAAVREAFGVTMPLREFLRTPTVAALAAAVRGGMPAPRPGPLIRLHDKKTGNPAVGIPGILGFGQSFAQLSAAMPDRAWYAVNLRDVAARHGELTVPVLVSDIADLVTEAVGGRPVHLVGHSYGGCLSHYLVTALRERGHQVASLTLLDALEPRGLAAELADTGEHRVWEFLTNVATVFPSATTRWAGELPSAADTLATAEALLGEEAKALFDGDLAAAFESYRRLANVTWPSSPPISCRALLVTATNPPTATAEQAWNWLPLLRNGLEKREIAASHVGMVQAPHAEPLAELLTDFFADTETLPHNQKAS